MTTAFDPIAVALKVTRALDDLGIAHTIGGAIAASFAGEPRASIDIDIVAALDEPQIADFVSLLGCCRNFAGSKTAPKSLTVNGATSSAL